MLTKSKKLEIIKKFGANEKDVGSSVVQIALLTEDINNITEHLKVAPKDFSSKRGLYRKSSQRKSLLNYLKNNDLKQYNDIVKKLNIRGGNEN